LGDRFLADAEYLKMNRPAAYEHEYLGIPTGTGGAVFENIVERNITDEEYAAFDRFNFGIDFGFAVDPFAWVKLHYDRKRQMLYLLDEIYEQKLSNRAAVERIRGRHSGNMRVAADSAEPKSIAEMASLGLTITGAKKGADSVEYGFKFLQDMDGIVIDKARTPAAHREFTLYEYETNKEGKYISVYPDRDNHILDAVRYALEPEMRRRRLYASRVKVFTANG
jgi:phage terminase large subunit